MTTKFNSTDALGYDPTTYEMTPEPVGTEVEVASGKIHFRPKTTTGVRRTWSVGFAGLDPADEDIVYAAYCAGFLGDIDWQGPDMVAHVHVRSRPMSWRDAMTWRADGTLLHSVSFVIREQV